MWLVILVAVVFAAIYIARAYMRKPHITGGSDSFYYHGSSKNLSVLEPQPSGVIGGERAVFATNNLSTALMFLGKWHDREISYGTYDGVHHAIELEPDSFDKLHASGYIHYVDPANFHGDPRLGMQDKEFISSESVPVIKSEFVQDAYERMTEIGEIHFIDFDTFISRVVGPESGRISRK